MTGLTQIVEHGTQAAGRILREAGVATDCCYGLSSSRWATDGASRFGVNPLSEASEHASS